MAHFLIKFEGRCKAYEQIYTIKSKDPILPANFHSYLA